MIQLDWPIIRAMLGRLSFALAVAVWLAVVILAWRQPRTEASEPSGPDSTPWALID